MISFQDVSAEYKGENSLVEALDSVSFTVSDGEPVSIIGPSGCGKSTLLHLAAGLLAPEKGQVLVDGEPLSGPRQQTALIPQDLGLFPWKTVLDNVAFPLLCRHIPKSSARKTAQDALEHVGLGTFSKAYIKELSGGMKQRVALARALAVECDLMLLDEPLSALDALSREQMQIMLLELWKERGHTQLLVTHSIEEAVFLGRRIFVLSHRPAKLVHIFDNPQMGEEGFRASDGFLECCNALREVLYAGAEEESQGGAATS